MAEWTDLLQQFWPSLLAALGLGFTFLPKGWTAKVRQTVAGVKDKLDGDDNATDSAKTLLEHLGKQRTKIANLQSQIAELEKDIANAERLVLKGGEA